MRIPVFISIDIQRSSLTFHLFSLLAKNILSRNLLTQQDAMINIYYRTQDKIARESDLRTLRRSTRSGSVDRPGTGSMTWRKRYISNKFGIQPLREAAAGRNESSSRYLENK
jgi:hypothetical protein